MRLKKSDIILMLESQGLKPNGRQALTEAFSRIHSSNPSPRYIYEHLDMALRTLIPTYPKTKVHDGTLNALCNWIDL